MQPMNGNGVHFPELTLGGVTYTVKFTRELMAYRLSKKGSSFADLGVPNKRYAAMFDILHCAIQDQFSGSVEDLVTLVATENKVRACDIAVADAIKKVYPSIQPARESADEPALQ